MLMILAVARRLPRCSSSRRERTWQPLEAARAARRDGRDRRARVDRPGGRARSRPRSAAGSSRRGAGPRPGADAADGAGDEPFLGAVMLDRVCRPSSCPELLAESDFVVLAAPLTAETEGLIGEAAIAAMKPGAWLINVARGELVDERALVRALRDGRIGGAVLDTFREEPLPPTSPLYDLPNVILTPHTSWSSDPRPRPQRRAVLRQPPALRARASRCSTSSTRRRAY